MPAWCITYDGELGKGCKLKGSGRTMISVFALTLSAMLVLGSMVKTFGRVSMWREHLEISSRAILIYMHMT